MKLNKGCTFFTGRQVSVAKRGMVTSPHSIASGVGLDILKKGGSAVDAAIATSATLSVIYPHMTGIGGDAFWLIYDSKNNSVNFLNGGGRAAASSNIDYFKKNSLKVIPNHGIIPGSLTTPGSVDSWCKAHEAFGKLKFNQIFESAIYYAKNGIPVTQKLSNWIKKFEKSLNANPFSASIFLKNGVPETGDLIFNPNLGKTLHQISINGRSGFYDGPVAKEMCRFVEENGGFFNEDDLRSQNSSWSNPIVGKYNDLKVYHTPPPTQGFTLIEMLNLLEPLKLKNYKLLSPDLIHLMIQAKQIAYNDRDKFLGDPSFSKIPIEKLISKLYAKKRSELIDPINLLAWDKVPSYGSLKGDTVYIAVTDEDGNGVSLIHSIYGPFGSTLIAGDTGVLLQNRGAYFSLEPNHPNSLMPGKIPSHTLTASIGTKNDRLWSLIGCMGADGQPQIQLQIYISLLDHHLNIQEAIEIPRWLSGRFSLGEPRDTLHMENRFENETILELKKRGHKINLWPEWHETAGHAHGIIYDYRKKIFFGGSDPRSDGAAVGF